MSGNPNLNRLLKQALYELKHMYGAPVEVYKIENRDPQNYRDGTKSASVSVINVRKCVVMPATTMRKFFQGISYLSASKAFASQGGPGWDGTTRAFMFEGRDLPEYEWDVQDWIVYRGERYEVSDIEALEYDSGWMIIGRAAKGLKPERIINLNVVTGFNPTDSGEGTL